MSVNGDKYVYHTKDPKKALEGGKIFVEQGHEALLKHWNADKQGTGKAQAWSGNMKNYPGPTMHDSGGNTFIPGEARDIPGNPFHDKKL